jgi:Tol biopolymer transport system component
VSGDGLSVVFTSRARNLVAGADANHDESDILLWRLDDSTITRVSVDNRGAQPSVGYSYSATVSHDGQWVAFVSTARLVSEDSNNAADVYLRNVRRGTTSLISRGMGGRLADGVSHAPMLSADGRFVVFVSKAGNLVPRDRNGQPDVFVYDVANRAIRLVSAAATGDTANADSRRPAISGDGRVIVYESVASNLGTGPGCPRVVSDTNLVPDVYLLDRTTRCVTRVSGSAQGEWWTPSVGPAIDGLGRLVVFSSTQPTSVDDLSADFHLFMFLRP